jgi:hypothetical protein
MLRHAKTIVLASLYHRFQKFKGSAGFSGPQPHFLQLFHINKLRTPNLCCRSLHSVEMAGSGARDLRVRKQTAKVEEKTNDKGPKLRHLFGNTPQPHVVLFHSHNLKHKPLTNLQRLLV